MRHYFKSNYLEKTQRISRHFETNNKMTVLLHLILYMVSINYYLVTWFSKLRLFYFHLKISWQNLYVEDVCNVC